MKVPQDGLFHAKKVVLFAYLIFGRPVSGIEWMLIDHLIMIESVLFLFPAGTRGDPEPVEFDDYSNLLASILRRQADK